MLIPRFTRRHFSENHKWPFGVEYHIFFQVDFPNETACLLLFNNYLCLRFWKCVVHMTRLTIKRFSQEDFLSYLWTHLQFLFSPVRFVGRFDLSGDFIPEKIWDRDYVLKQCRINRQKKRLGKKADEKSE